MRRKEKAVALLLSLVILGALAYLLLFAPIGSLGSEEGQSFEVDRFFLIGFIVVCLASGYFLVRRQDRRP